MLEALRRIYPKCSERELMDLMNSMKEGKFWRVAPKDDRAIYVVALTRAKYPEHGYFRARVTHLGSVPVSREAARFCRRARILLLVKEHGSYVARHVITWPAFLKIMRRCDPEKVMKILEEGSLPTFLNERAFVKIREKLA